MLKCRKMHMGLFFIFQECEGSGKRPAMCFAQAPGALPLQGSVWGSHCPWGRFSGVQAWSTAGTGGGICSSRLGAGVVLPSPLSPGS